MENINPDTLLKSMLKELPLRPNIFDILKSYNEYQNIRSNNKPVTLAVSEGTENFQEVEVSKDIIGMLTNTLDNKIKTSSDLKKVFDHINEVQTCKKIKGKPPTTANSFKFLPTVERSRKKFNELCTKMIDYKFIHKDTTFLGFKEIFTTRHIYYVTLKDMNESITINDPAWFKD